MKSLKRLLEASLLDIDTNLDITDSDIIKDTITKFINDNYKTKEFTISKNTNKDGKFEVSTKYNVVVKNKSITSLTNDLFVWDKVGNCFSCSFCDSLQFLEGAPKEVGGNFICSFCKSLKSLEGAPEKVGSSFYCFECSSLKSLKFAPEKIGEDFYCYNCKSLQSLKGAPKKVEESFSCYNCKVKFKESDVRAVSNVKGRIYV